MLYLPLEINEFELKHLIFSKSMISSSSKFSNFDKSSYFFHQKIYNITLHTCQSIVWSTNSENIFYLKSTFHYYDVFIAHNVIVYD